MYKRQGEAIATSLALMSSLTVPVVTVVIGEGGSGGALALEMCIRDRVCPNACGHHNTLIRNLLALSAQKNLNLSRKIFHTSPKTIRGRLLSYLSYQSKRSGSSSFTIPFSRQQLADYLNVDRSALSNELSKMQRDGLIQVERNRFVLLGV